jgi:hypothetical protein
MGDELVIGLRERCAIRIVPPDGTRRVRVRATSERALADVRTLLSGLDIRIPTRRAVLDDVTAALAVATYDTAIARPPKQRGDVLDCGDALDCVDCFAELSSCDLPSCDLPSCDLPSCDLPCDPGCL